MFETTTPSTFEPSTDSMETPEIGARPLVRGSNQVRNLDYAFLVDPKGKLAEVWYKVSPKDTPELLTKSLKALE